MRSSTPWGMGHDGPFWRACSTARWRSGNFPVSRPAISQHLSILKHANLVVDRAEGTRRLYALNPEAFDSLREYFDHFWTHAMAAFKKRVEKRPAK